MTFNIIIDDAVVAAEQLFSPFGELIIVPGKDIPKYAKQADALIIRSRTKITDTLLEHSNIKFIGSTVVGLDHVDIEACQRHQAHFYSAQGCNARSVAEYVIFQAIDYANQQKKPFNQLTIGVIGVGNVGRIVTQLAAAIGFNIIMNDPPRAERESEFIQADLNTLLSESDIITLHTPLIQTGPHPTIHLLNENNLPLISPTARIINAARGHIIDEEALLRLTTASLIIDCWQDEPNINQALLTRSQLATPHIAGHAWDAKYKGGEMVKTALAQFLHYPTSKMAPPIEPPAIIELPLSDSSSPTEQLMQILRRAYDFTVDDQILRQSTALELQHNFEDYRRHYPLRREWTEHTVQCKQLHAETCKWLGILGFKTGYSDFIPCHQ